MAEKNIKTRVQNKHDVEANWEKAKSFIPLKGEIIIYDADENYNLPRIKIGDGVKTIGELEFVDEAVIKYTSQILSSEQ